MSDNVIILGAGASADARIPLMSDFIQTMWEMSIRGKIRTEKLTQTDHVLMIRAMAIKETLDNYHGRVYFNDRNLEDILSILTFNAMAGGGARRKELEIFVKAISRTIELTSCVQHNGEAKHYEGCPGQYTQLWQKLLVERYPRTGSLPTIITFNYDLVLERSLYHLCASYLPDRLPVDGLSFMYHYDKLQRVDLSKTLRDLEYRDNRHPGTWLTIGRSESPAEIEILKLHGSINFPKTRPNQESLPVLAVDNPLIMPPIFSKMEYGKGLNGAWRTALQRLREAKNVIIVGYSLPITDIYMQYFLKAGLGPNTDLNKIFIFDPVLYGDEKARRPMEERYKTCFSPQMQDRLVFQPPGGEGRRPAGNFIHFVDRLDEVLF
jgi:hypothetical protein